MSSKQLPPHDSLPPLPPGFEHANQNRAAFPLDELIRYRGQYVAWNGDSTRIVASGPDIPNVEAKLAAAGIDPTKVVYEYIPEL
jgi:hypothetical protein